MAHDVFISHSTEGKNKPIADAVCAELEKNKIRCWIAPRDVAPGHSFAGEIVEAITSSRVFVLVFSNESNRSPQVLREVERAVNKGIPIIPFRIEDFTPSKDMEYFLGATHWLDALTPPLEKHLHRLVEIVHVILAEEKEAEPGPPRELLPRVERMIVRPGWFWAGSVILTLWLVWQFIAMTLLMLDKMWYLRLLFCLLLALPLLIPGVFCLRRGMAVDLMKEQAEKPVPKPWWVLPVGLGFAGGMISYVKHRSASRRQASNILTLGIVATIIWIVPLSFCHHTTPGVSFKEIGRWQTSWTAHDVFVSGDTAYLANGKAGLFILDVSDPSNPREIGQCPLEDARGVVVVDNLAYVVGQGEVREGQAESDRLVLIDVGVPANPRKLVEVAPEESYSYGSLDNFAVEGHTVYLTASDRLVLLDMTAEPASILLGEFKFTSNISSPGVAVADGMAYIMANRLHVVDAKNPSQPVEVGGFETGWGTGIALAEETAYLAGWDDGFITLDISSPSKVVKLGGYNEIVTPTSGVQGRQLMSGVSVSGSVAYVTYNYGIVNGTWTDILEEGVIALDVSDPYNPQKIAVNSELEGVSSVFASGDLVFITEEDLGLRILTLE
jgi:hypothetical protein